MGRFQRLSKGEVLFSVGLALFLGGGIALQAELRAQDSSEVWAIVWAVATGLGLLLLAITAFEHFKHRHDADSPPEIHRQLGEPGTQLDSLLAATNQLANILEKFDNWWPAIGGSDYSERLPDGTSTITHAEAMQTLLYAFAQFFSAARTYEDHNGDDWHRNRDLKELVREVYRALGERPIGPVDDETIMSGQLHRIGELSTERWRSADARPFGPADFEVKAEKNPQLAGALEPLKRFLLAAEPGTEAHDRVKAAEQAVKRVKVWLEKHHRP